MSRYVLSSIVSFQSSFHDDNLEMVKGNHKLTFSTTVPAATVAPRPMLTPGLITTLPPMNTLSAMCTILPSCGPRAPFLPPFLPSGFTDTVAA